MFKLVSGGITQGITQWGATNAMILFVLWVYGQNLINPQGVGTAQFMASISPYLPPLVGIWLFGGSLVLLASALSQHKPTFLQVIFACLPLFVYTAFSVGWYVNGQLKNDLLDPSMLWSSLIVSGFVIARLFDYARGGVITDSLMRTGASHVDTDTSST